MRRRLLSFGCAGTELAVAIALAGCGADAAALCDFGECTPQSGAGLNDGSAGGDGTTEGGVPGPDAPRHLEVFLV